MAFANLKCRYHLHEVVHPKKNTSLRVISFFGVSHLEPEFQQDLVWWGTCRTHGWHMCTVRPQRPTGVSHGGQRFEEVEEAVESRGWIGQRYSYGAQVFWSILERCFVTSVCLHEPRHSL